MTTADNLKSLGGVVVGLLIMVGMVTLGIAILYGAAEFSLWALEWIPSVFAFLSLICILIFIPLSLIPHTRGIAGNGFYISSIIFGFVLWVFAMAYTYVTWGLFPVILGLTLGGIGVVPIAALASIVEGQWAVLGNLAVLIALTFGLRILAVWLVEKAAEREIAMAERKAISERIQLAHRIDE